MKKGVKKTLAWVSVVAILAGSGGTIALADVDTGTFNFTLAARGSEKEGSSGVTKTTSGDATVTASSASGLSDTNTVVTRVRRSSDLKMMTGTATIKKKLKTYTMSKLSGVTYSTGKSYKLYGQTSSTATKSVTISGNWKP